MDVAKVVDQVIARFIGTKHERDIKKLQPVIAAINAREAEVQSLSDEDLKTRFAELRAQVQEQLKDADPAEPAYKQQLQQALEPAIVPAFALVREAGRRFLNMRHFDVQLIGGIVLHEGKISEMKTGEGKTLVATLPAVLNALAGRGVHIVTVNDYLARRDAEWMSPLYRALGLSVGVIVHDLDDDQRRAAYGADITYGTNNEFGFDYLRDNMKYDLAQCVQRGHQFAIVDEVDSILIDEARTPLIISGPSEESTDKYAKIDKIIPKLIQDIDYTLDEKHRTATLTEEGFAKCERLLSLTNMSDPANIDIMHHVYQALRAHTLYKHDVDYVVKDGEVIIVDEFTGRQMPGRRWSDGLHQAVEAKEGVKIERENQTLATITFQNYFRMYKKLSGMTGTAETEAAEFGKIYNLDVTVIPTNRHLIRIESPDVVYRTEKEKFEAVVNGIMQEDNSLANGIRQYHKRGQPVLVGTISIEKSEAIAELLKKAAIPHQVLNAKQHERESRVVAQAGRKGAVTIATNMAGRGTDILLGGNPDFMAREFLKAEEIDPEEADDTQWNEAFTRAKQIVEAEHKEVVQNGGLHILGTERHESRRIDNQLRGRSGRQGDPGSSRFFLSLEDDLMRIFAGDKVKALMQRLGMEKGVAIESKMVSKRIEAAQKSVEGRNFESRKHLLEYDDVMNKQRETIYGLRRRLMEEPDQREYLVGEKGVARDLLEDITKKYLNPDVPPDAWDVDNYKLQVQSIYALNADVEGIDFQESTEAEVENAVWAKAIKHYEEKEQQIGVEAMRTYERIIMLNIIDAQWKDHLLSLDHVKQGIGLVGYGQKDPLVEYKKQSFVLFEEMLDRIDTTTIRSLFNLQIVEEQPPEALRQRRRPRSPLTFTGPNQGAAAAGEEAGKVKTVVRDQPKVGRNEACPCGSGKKYKKCHGAAA